MRIQPFCLYPYTRPCKIPWKSIFANAFKVSEYHVRTEGGNPRVTWCFLIWPEASWDSVRCFQARQADLIFSKVLPDHLLWPYNGLSHLIVLILTLYCGLGHLTALMVTLQMVSERPSGWFWPEIRPCHIIKIILVSVKCSQTNYGGLIVDLVT